MRRIVVSVLLAAALGGCGYTERDGELIGQVKKVAAQTPLVCPDHVAVDISLGVMVNGVGSLSKEDVWFRVMNQSDVEGLRRMAERGAIVKVRYNVRRLTFCFNDHQLLYFEEVR